MPITEDNTGSVGKAHRIFFAIWPDNDTQNQLVGLTKQLRLESLCGGRKIKAENIHLTLVFVGKVYPDRLEVLRDVADSVKRSVLPAFDLVIDEVRYWKHNHIVYVAPGKVPQELINLEKMLRDAISAAGFPLEQRAYAPHITLMSNAFCPALAELAEPVAWRVREWTLVKSEQTSNGSVYTPIGRWSLETSNKP
ncbi:RNA 2',3'-cyclic phosphodiesterase [Nitrosospira sp. NRS527]|uniref:RNA 2',3'-cyclic phosphodiesterase n=1 Tax=Nitrosospira sp. NRS527 TaxID=155925 RepID=UPI001AF4FE41|nr:RNA 2',3'-cyclic phosphodiesterase [Nitrosospira sp. NRS527]BCT68667.1 RNA 2',3'-cyclic phosphodiesterase [Nitrosospira sp. NRS527]